MGKNTTLFRFSSFFLLFGTAFFLMGFQTNSLTIQQDSIVDVVCPGAKTGSISVTVTGGNGSLTYSWTGPGTYTSNSEDISNLAAGTYTLTVKDQTSPDPLTASKEFVVAQNDTEAPTISQPVDVSVVTDTGKCTASNVSLPAPTIDDNCGVTSIENDAPPVFPIGITQVTWTAMDASGNIQTATQKVTVKDTEKPTISAPAGITVSSDTGSCAATRVTLGTATTNDNCGVQGVSNDAPASFPFGNTTVTWTVTDNAGNTQTDTQIVTVNDTEKPTISAPADVTVSSDPGSCAGTGVTLGTATTNDNCGVKGVTNDAPASFPLGNTTVTWTVTDNAGNTQTDTQIVTVNDTEKPTISAPADVTVSSDTGSCAATMVTLGTATTNDNCGVKGVTNDAPASFPLGNTTVTWTVTDNAGNTRTDTQTVTVTDTEKPVISAGSNITTGNDPGYCYASVEVISATASDNCSVGTPTGTRSDGKPLTDTYPVGTTTITWTVTDAGGNPAAPAEQIVTVNDTEPPKIPVLENILRGCEFTVPKPTTTDNCAGTITGTTTDPLTYSAAGNYSINWVFDDKNGNIITVPQQITIDPVKAEAKVTDVLCSGFSTGEATITGLGGVGPYTYTWTSLGIGNTKKELAAGTYSVVVTDSNGCKSDPLEVIITEPDTFLEITNISVTSGCYAQNNAGATVEAQGGTGAYTYLWSDGQTTQTASGLTAGEHSVTVTDENGCEATKTVTISAAEELLIPSVSTTQTTSFGTATGTATANVSGGTSPYTFSWSNGATGQIARDLASGNYSVTVTDANGCSYTKAFTIIDPLEATIVPKSSCLTEVGGIRTSEFRTENVRGGTGPYSYQWDFGLDSSPSTAIGAGPHIVKYTSTGDKTITLILTDAKGRTITKTLVQYVGECFEACGETQNLDVSMESFYIGKENGDPLTSSDCSTYTGKKYIFLKSTQNANAYSPSVEYIYTLRDLNTGTTIGSYKVISCLAEYDEINKEYLQIPQLLNLGEVAEWSCGYSIKMENFYMSWTNNRKRGCGENPRMMCLSTNKDDEIAYPLYASATAKDLLCYGTADGTITVRASGGQAPYMYSLNGVDFQSSDTFSGLSGGLYTATVKDNLGQTVETTGITISEPSNPLTIQSPVVKDPVTCHGGSDGSATVEVSGGTPFSTGEPYIYVWSDSQTTATATGLKAGNYTVTIIDSNGCEITETIAIEQPDSSPANAGTDQVLACGVTTTTIGSEIPVSETGKWEVVNGPSGWLLEDPTTATTSFTGKIGTYTLRWTESCGSTDDVKITVSDCSTIDFDGDNDYIEFGDSYDQSGDFSIEAWVKLKSTMGVKTVLSKRDFSNITSSGYDLIIDNSVPKFRWNGNTVASEYPVDTNRWYHLAVSSGSSGTAIYIDGIKVGSGAQATPAANDHPFLLGAIYNTASKSNPENYFHGWIEEVRIWNTGISKEQLRFMMNQKLVENGGAVQGKEIPLNVPDNLNWIDLTGYYHLETVQSGFVVGETVTSVKGKLRNITTIQEHSAPLPYISKRNGNWNDTNPTTTPWLYGDGIWHAPNSAGVLKDSIINWNIVRVSHDISSGSRDITLLGLISEDRILSISKSGDNSREYDPGQMLRVTDYLKLNGAIDLIGESQLLQDEGSILAENSSGYIERDQQGTASSFNYNYWSSPVTPTGSITNGSYTVKSVLRDGTNPSDPIPLVFNNQFQFADWKYSGAKRISSFWLHIYSNNTSNAYSQWQHVGETGKIQAGEGFSMKGTMGSAKISDRQNYTFVGKPNNGTIQLTINAGNDYLVGNPYPSAIDSEKFILDNISAGAGNNSRNVFNGTLYFWDHFSGKTHYLQEYVGGYATLNLSGAVVAVATDQRINATGDSATVKPGRFIPVGQGFLVSTQTHAKLQETVSGGDILFKNSQRTFETDDQPGDNSVFKSKENTKEPKGSSDKRQKIYLYFNSPEGYLRQLLVTSDVRATDRFDLGFDAPLIENNKEDMYWVIDSIKSVIQGVPDFNRERVLPLGVKIKQDGDFHISIDQTENIPEDFRIFLKDSLTKIVHDLRQSPYKTSASAGMTDDRFSIVFKEKEIPYVEEEPEEEVTSGPLELHYSNNSNEVVIRNPELLPVHSATIYNVLGQKLQQFPNIAQERQVHLEVRQLPPGVYIVKLELETGKKSIKFVKE